ncbi:DEAD/DEAH box helicase, partial [bacterium]|nr:DEAD/DEAH box helicase [bacterium]
HFDRWWNPAVENQATDRAYRIGQKKSVMVHKFLTQGTVEEKIDEMLIAKSKLSDGIVAKSGENWITEMNNDELLELFTMNI